MQPFAAYRKMQMQPFAAYCFLEKGLMGKNLMPNFAQ